MSGVKEEAFEDTGDGRSLKSKFYHLVHFIFLSVWIHRLAFCAHTSDSL